MKGKNISNKNLESQAIDFNVDDFVVKYAYDDHDFLYAPFINQ